MITIPSTEEASRTKRKCVCTIFIIGIQRLFVVHSPRPASIWRLRLGNFHILFFLHLLCLCFMLLLSLMRMQEFSLDEAPVNLSSRQTDECCLFHWAWVLQSWAATIGKGGVVVSDSSAQGAGQDRDWRNRPHSLCTIQHITAVLYSTVLYLCSRSWLKVKSRSRPHCRATMPTDE